MIGERASSETRNTSCTVSGNTNGLNDREKGHMGVNSSPGTAQWTSEPPAAMLYAVDPDGVEIMILSLDYPAGRYPSACTVVRAMIAYAVERDVVYRLEPIDHYLCLCRRDEVLLQFCGRRVRGVVQQLQFQCLSDSTVHSIRDLVSILYAFNSVLLPSEKALVRTSL